MNDPRNPSDPGSPPFGSTSTPPGSSPSADKERDSHGDAGEKAKQTAQDMKRTAQQQTAGLLDQQKGVIAEQTEKLATVFQKMAEHLDQQDQHYLSGFANNLARSTDVLSQRLRDKDINTLLTQAQDYSRRQPAVFMAGAIATGFLLARFMGSSANHQHDREKKSHPASSDTTF